MKLLTIAVPTYNRAAKIGRLLEEVIRQVHEHQLRDDIDIIVSDNASEENVEAIVARYQRSGVDVTYFRQPTNLGFDGNLLSLYSLAKGQFIWWMGSDDLPSNGIMGRVVTVLRNKNLDVLVGSFLQPRTGKAFDFNDPVKIVSDIGNCVDLIYRQPKLSAHILRRIELSEPEHSFLRDQRGNGWMHLALAYTLLDRASPPRLAVISDYIASSDQDYNRLDWTPEPYLRIHRTMLHPFVRRASPEFAQMVRVNGYRTAIGLCFSVCTGSFSVSSQEDYVKFIGHLEWRPEVLLRHPGSLFRLAAIKSGAARHMWPLTKYMMPWVRRMVMPASASPKAPTPGSTADE